MNELTTLLGDLTAITYTAAMLGWILYRGFIRETDAARAMNKRRK